MTNYCVQW